MITINLVKPIEYQGAVIKGFQMRPPLFKDIKRFSGQENFYVLVMQALAEPIDCDLPVEEKMLDLLVSWDYKQIEAIIEGFFVHPLGLTSEQKREYGISEKWCTGLH